jgi:hypothetical protein
VPRVQTPDLPGNTRNHIHSIIAYAMLAVGWTGAPLNLAEHRDLRDAIGVLSDTYGAAYFA